MNSLFSKLKIFIIATITLIVAGLAILGFLGFNKAIDFKKSYEVRVSLTQDVNGATAVAKEKAEEYFAEKKQNQVEYSFQKTEDGEGFIFKFEKLSGVDATELQTKINQALEVVDSTKNTVATVTIDEVVPASYSQVWKVVLSLGVSFVVCFIYLLCTHKFRSAISAIISSALACVLFVALIALTRIPAYPFFDAMVVGVAVISCLLSSGMLNRFREEARLNEKATDDELSNKVIKDSILRYAFVAGALALVSIIFIIFGSFMLKYLGLQLLVAGVSATFVSLLWMPLFWTLLKGNK